MLDAGIQRFGLIYVPVKIQFDVSSWNASNTIFKDYSSDLATDRWCVLLLAEDTPIVVFTDPWIFADRLIFGLLVIINNWENNQQLGIFDDWDPGPAEKIVRGPHGICDDWDFED